MREAVARVAFDPEAGQLREAISFCTATGAKSREVVSRIPTDAHSLASVSSPGSRMRSADMRAITGRGMNKEDTVPGARQPVGVCGEK